MTDLIGYQLCACGIHVADEVAWLTDGRCVPCHRNHLDAMLQPIVIAVRGQRMSVARVAGSPAEIERRRRKDRAKAERRKHDPVLRRRKHLSEHAKRRALRRLKALYPEVYDLLLVEERAVLGLPAYTAHRAVQSAGAGAAYKTLGQAGIYHPDP